MKKISLIGLLLLVFLLHSASLFAQSNDEVAASESHERYCAVLEKAFMAHYDTTVTMLRQSLEQQLITRQEFGSSLEKVSANLNQMFQNIDAYADQLEMLQKENEGGDFEALLNNFVVLNFMSEVDHGTPTAFDGSEDFDFLFKGLSFVDACTYFGDFYLNLDMKEQSVYYYTMALEMYETLNGYEDSDFKNQIKQLQSIISRIMK